MFSSTMQKLSPLRMMMSRSGPCSVVDGASEDFIEEANEMKEI